MLFDMQMNFGAFVTFAAGFCDRTETIWKQQANPTNCPHLMHFESTFNSFFFRSQPSAVPMVKYFNNVARRAREHAQIFYRASRLASELQDF